MTEEETSLIMPCYEKLIKSHHEWWSNRDSIILEKQQLHLNPDTIKKLKKIIELELQMQTAYLEYIDTRREFYSVLDKCGFETIKIVAWLDYIISRKEDGIKKSYKLERSNSTF